MKLFLLVVIFTLTGTQANAQSTSDSIPKRLKLQCKKFSTEGKYDSAYYVANKLKAYAIRSLDTVLLLNSYYRLGFYANKSGDPIQALDEFNEGIDLNTSLEMKAYKIPILYQKCGILNRIGDYKEVQKIAIYGIELSKKFDPSYIRDFYNEFAIASANNLEFEAAKEAYGNALKYSIKDLKKASILNNIGVNYKHQKKYAQAVKIYDSILNQLEFDSPKLRAKIESNLGFSLSKLGNEKRSLPLLKSALNIRISEKDYSGMFASYIHLTSYYSKLSKVQAIHYAKKAYEIACFKTKSPDSQEEALLNIITLNAATDKEATRYAFLSDSLQRSKRKTINEYTAAKFQIKEREVEIANQKEQIAKNETQKSYYLLGFVTITICLLSFFIYVFQRRKILSRNHEIATLEARENERNNISGKVHDYVGDKIREAMLFADHYEIRYPDIGFASLGDKVEKAYQELRKVSQDYMYLDFDKINFPKRIQGLSEEREELYSIAIDVQGIGDLNWSEVLTTSKTELYRSLQELLVNVSKHSKATQVLVFFEAEKRQINMKVKDNGVGCDFSENIENTGLIDLKRRITNLGGIVTIFSEPNNGFQVEISVPLN